MRRNRKISLVGVVFAVATTVAGASVWIHTELDEKISVSEFQRFVEMQQRGHEEILRRLRSIEEAIWEIR